MFKVRKWSDTNARPYDVVFEHNGRSHFQPGCTFSTEEKAQEHLSVLEKRIQENPGVDKFIIDTWPTD